MILDDIALMRKKRVAEASACVPLEALREQALMLHQGTHAFSCALRGSAGLAVIAEVKKASPSKGVIAFDFPYIDIAREYSQAGAAAISVLTEPDFFMGSNEYLSCIAQSVQTPLLRKDFIIDEYQIYEAKVLGASAILLIAALLDEKTLERFLSTASVVGLDVLCEAHTADEIKTLTKIGAPIIGINNRDLQTFNVDLETTERLRSLIPEGTIAVSESGINTHLDAARLRNCGIDAVLIGEALMRCPDKASFIRAVGGNA
ncbi:MAG: indole-3-glycerol phosphate synthase TrpC [Termitinemataceae bacterium]|nr:MAG: indole-3-glycerol phosphate synthase TrpC [Termitinemataceae bacterium]